VGVVVDYLAKSITDQVSDCGIVVWYDPENAYTDLVSQLDIPDTTIAHYEGSFFALRRAVDHLMNGLEPPRLVVYVPMNQLDSQNALVELEAAGTVMKPGEQSAVKNTQLSFIAQNAAILTGQCTEECVKQLVKDIEAGKLKTIEEIEQVIGHGKPSVLQIIFGSFDPEDIALTFLSDPSRDKKIEEKMALGELEGLLQLVLQISSLDTESVSDYRKRLSRYVLATEFVAGLGDNIPAKLQSIKIAEESAAQSVCIKLANHWRARRDLRDSYIEFAKQVENELGLRTIDFSLDQLAELETFPVIEAKLHQIVEDSVLQNVTEQDFALVKTKKNSFWAESVPEVRARWELLSTSIGLLLEADNIEAQLQSAKAGAKAVFESYTANAHPWCQLDTLYRHLERQYNEFNFGSDKDYDALQKVIAKAKNRYSDVGAALAEKFLRELSSAKFELPGILKQSDIWAKKVKSRLASGKVAYVWVDALRYEMARELAQALQDDFELEFVPATATVPTITEIGMASLLPNAENGLEIVPAGEGKLALKVNDTVIKDRPGRVKFLKEHAGVEVFDVKLDDLLPNPSKKIRDGIKNADLILVTSQEIDLLAEGDHVALARRVMDSMLYELARGFRMLEQLGVETIVVTADHGYLFGDELGTEMKIDPPGGKTVDLHRRVWVGKGGTADQSYMRADIAEFGLAGDLEIAAPWNFAAFKAIGSNAYFHGGLSPQELIIPVITLLTKEKAASGPAADIEWILSPGSDRISTRFYSVMVQAKSTGLFDFTPPRVLLEVREKGEPVSRAVSASYGFEQTTGEVHLRMSSDDPRSVDPNTITLMITQEPKQKTLSLHLLDATTGTELARLDKIEAALLEY